ncbi:MAG TPA: ASKHA domain-containing protein [Nitriliruptoraceae bacterium]|nr:ASKHA domain-containing protein [Nitriliruptoraceae bacterium]
MTPGSSDAVAVTFTPSGRRGQVARGTTVLDAARGLGVDLDSVCGGRAICGHCQVTVGARPGTDANPDRLAPPGPTERDFDGARPLADDHRLGCIATVVDDVVIDVPAASQVHRQVVRKAVGNVTIDLDPVVRAHHVEVAVPTLDDQRGDLERLEEALAREWDLADLAVAPAALAALQPALAAGDHAVTVAIRDGEVIVAVWPGFVDRLFGLAVDIGSTTIAGHLCELASGQVLASGGRMNPQMAWGEDLMSRVSHVMMHDDGQERLTGAVRQALAELAEQLCDQADVSVGDVLEVVVVGNPIMHHLFFGLDPRPLGTAPFALTTTRALDWPAREVGLAVLHPAARVHAPPCIAGHVGADAAAMVLADGPHRANEVTLLVDVGTNAEIVLGNRHRLLAASSPTGPAFEGAQVSSGQRAAPGAIERVRVDRDTLEPRLRVIGSDLWSNQDGFAEAIATTGITGICGSGIIEVLGQLFLAGVIAADGTIVDPTGAGTSPRIVDHGRTLAYRLHDDPVIEVTQQDVRAIQLAKAALHAGCRLLMDRLGVDQVERVHLAGAFGSHIDPTHALLLGLVPDCAVEHVTSVGNAAGNGAVMALLSRRARREVATVTGRIEKVETATEAAFQEHFVAAMALPHGTSPTPHLAAAVDLPATTATGPQRTASGRARRRNRGDRARRPATDTPTAPHDQEAPHAAHQ